MSGIAGVLRLDGAPVAADDVRRMTHSMAHRGPDAQHIWCGGPTGLGHAALWTTPEAVGEQQPLSLDGQVWITADARLDDPPGLRLALEAKGRPVAKDASDTSLILHSYAVWGEDCVYHLIGDFAFALWDGRLRKLVCARDRMGVRTLLYSARAPWFVFASDVHGLRRCSAIDLRIYEPRIGDYLLELEWYDKTTTPYEHVYGLAPGHVLVVSDGRVTVREYWRYEARPAPGFRRDGDYEEAFLELFTRAVRTRLRAPEPAQVGSMLSGGLDSSSIVAVAREDYRARGLAPFATVSAAAHKTPGDALESYCIDAVIAQGSLEPLRILPEAMAAYQEELTELLYRTTDLFDHWMILAQIANLAARRHGMRILLTGSGGNEIADLPLDYPYSWFRQGRLRDTVAAVRGLHAFYEHPRTRVLSNLYQYGRWLGAGLLAGSAAWQARMSRRTGRLRDRAYRLRLADAIIDPVFAARIDLCQRYMTAVEAREDRHLTGVRARQVAGLNTPLLDIGLARYDRVAALSGIETRHPYTDQRLVEFLLAIPPEQIVRGHWPKGLVRAAMRGLLTDDVRYRRGIQHVGWTFLQARWQREQDRFRAMLDAGMGMAAPYVDAGKVRAAYARWRAGDEDAAEDLWYALTLMIWLEAQAMPPA